MFELVGACISPLFRRKGDVEGIGLYHDDSLASLHKISGSMSHKMQKDNIKRNYHSQIVNFFDVTLHL